MMELWQSADQFTFLLSPLAVSEAAFKPHQQLGDPGTTQPRAFLQDVSSLHTCCKAAEYYFYSLNPTLYGLAAFTAFLVLVLT